MKVIIPVIDNQSGRNNIASGFHNAEYVCIYDCANTTCEWVRTKDISNQSGILGQELLSQNITTVISHSMPLMALGVFTGCGLKVLKSSGTNLQYNIKLFQNNQLEAITAQSTLVMSACSGSCKSCITTCN